MVSTDKSTIFITFLAISVLMSTNFSPVSAVCCHSTRVAFLTYRCADGERGTPCCGNGGCNMFCCNCDSCRGDKIIDPVTTTTATSSTTTTPTTTTSTTTTTAPTTTTTTPTTTTTTPTTTTTTPTTTTTTPTTATVNKDSVATPNKTLDLITTTLKNEVKDSEVPPTNDTSTIIQTNDVVPRKGGFWVFVPFPSNVEKQPEDEKNEENQPKN